MSENKSAPYTFTKDGVFYFVRRVPRDLKGHYTSSRIAFSLRTRSTSVAASRAARSADKLDQYWYHLRSQSADLPGKHLLRLGRTGDSPHPVSGHRTASVAETVTLSEAVALYLRLKGAGRAITFHRAAERACGYVIDVCGDRMITDYTRADANAFRDALLARGMAGSSITRVLGTVRAVLNFAANEQGITLSNAFQGVYYDRRAGVEDRKPVPMDALRRVQAECHRLDDDLRWLVALVSDTGMRLTEAAGLLREDLVLDAEIPYVRITPHEWRPLKTDGSKRDVPLVGEALWAAERIVNQETGSRFAFPRYNKASATRANSASAALNKWLKGYVPEGCTMHGFRHAMRDRLRAVECPADIADQIGGWQTEGVGHGYGRGYPLTVMQKWLIAVRIGTPAALKADRGK